MTDKEQKQAAKEFAAYWEYRGYEKGESQSFWLSLLRDVLGVEHPERFIRFEDKVMLDHASFIDGHIPTTHVLIEQKSKDNDLRKAIKQSNGTLLTPLQQAKRYSQELPYSERPRWIITCNFKEFLIYDMEKPNGEPEQILIRDLPKEYYRLKFIVDTESELLKQETETVRMIDKKDSERRQFNWGIVKVASSVLVAGLVIGVGVLGGNVNIKLPKKL